MSTENIQQIEPVKPVAPYLGGKNRLAKRICARINKTPHEIYAEPFVGMGGVFLRRTHQPKAEIINDFNNEVSNLFRILQRHYSYFLNILQFELTTRHRFNQLVDTQPHTLTDLERAARFLYLQRTAFGGKISGRNFGVSPDRPARFDVTKLAPMLEDLHTRLAGVVIESLDYKDFIPRYDRPGTLFYLDPPYCGNENDYGRGMFGREDFQHIADLLSGIKGRFILSINDQPNIRDLFSAFQVEPVALTYSVAKKGATSVRELIISN